MKNTDKLIEFLRENNSFKQLYQNGSTPDEIKQQIVNSLQPFFKNRENLEKNAVNLLISDYINLNRVRNKYSDIDNDIRLVLNTYYDALLVNEKLLCDTISALFPDAIEAGNKFWSFVYLERDKDELEFFEFVKEIFENIGDIIEGIIKIQVIENVAINQIIRGKSPNLSKIKSTKLGVLLDELIQHSRYPHLLTTQPDDIKISDWRNITAHKSYYIKEESVVCQFGISPKEKSFCLSRLELADRANQITRTLEVFNLAHKFFGFDNIHRLSPKLNINPDERLGRDEIWLLFFITGIYSQGFEVIKFNYASDEKALMIVKDLTIQNPKERGIHSSQFILPVWVGTRAKEITVEYRLSNDKLFLRAFAKGEICEAIYSGKQSIEYLADNVKFEVFR